jgi:Tol biopolymer transport system component
VAVLLAEGSGTNIWAIPTAGGPLRKLTEFEGRRALIARRVSWSSDSRFIYAAVGDGDADVVLMDGLTP